MACPKEVKDWQDEYKAMTHATLCEFYDSRAEKYDKVFGPYQDDGHVMTILTVKDLIPNKSARILDFTASTGLFGKLLHDNGYTNVDALDGSTGCMERARERNVYKNYIVEFVSDARLSIDDDSYDALTCYGGMAKNHLPISVFSEWIRCVKPGGFIINAFRMKWLKDAPSYSEGKLETEIERLEKEKKWKFISRETTNDEDPDKVVIKFAHQVC